MIDVAITKVRPIKTDGHVINAIRYAISDKVNPENENEPFHTFSTYINTFSDRSANKIADSWKAVRKSFGKDNNNLAFQIVQNFGEGISPELANEIGVKFARELLKNRQIIVSTHTNTAYTHNHIIFNSPDLDRGEKYYDNNDSYYNKVRKISDRLCEEYGLKVLEDTRDGTLIFYKDTEGKTRFFETTKRKRELKHYDSRYAQADVWNADMHRRKNRANKILQDMDMVIPLSDDFEDFLIRMKNLGYGINAKTSKGEWRKHITYFDPDRPENSKGIRDTNTLLAGYTRKEIEDKICKYRELQQEQNREENNIFSNNYSNEIEVEPQDEPRVIYDDVDKIREDIRYDKTKRSKVDKLLVSEIKTMRKQVNDDFYSAFKRSPMSIQPRNAKEKKDMEIIKRINAKMRTLNFMESYKVYAPSALESKMNNILFKRDEAAKELDGVRSKLNVMNRYVAAINTMNNLKENIEKQTLLYGKAYTEAEGLTEIKSYNDLVDMLKSVNLYEQEQQDKYLNNVEQYKAEYSQLVRGLQNISDSLYQCDDIYRVMKQIGYESEEIKRYEQIRFAKKQEQKKEREYEK